MRVIKFNKARIKPFGLYDRFDHPRLILNYLIKKSLMNCFGLYITKSIYMYSVIIDEDTEKYKY